jgi:hypothetical protein
MGFVQIGFLGALGALAIPVVIHLIFRRRTRRVDLGTLRFLKVVLKENARRRKVKRWLLLSLRMACVALLALAFARPYLIAGAAGRSERFVAILIDRSASMQLADNQGRLIDRAVAEARQVIAQADERTRVEVAFFDDAVHPLTDGADPQSQSTREIETLSDRLRAPENLFGATDYGAALAWARDVCVKAAQTRKEVFLFTDLQRSGLDWSEVAPLPPEVAVHIHDLGRATVNNVAVTSARPERSVIRPGETATVHATVFNAGPFPLELAAVLFHLESDGRKYTRREHVNLEPGAVANLDFEIADLPQGFWTGAVEIEVEDDLPFDNRRHLAVLAAPRLPVLLVDGSGRTSSLLSETYFLEAALRLAPPGEIDPESPFAPTVLRWTEDARLPDLRETAVVVLADVPSLIDSDSRRLAEFVAAGGSLFVFCGENVAAGGYRSLESAGLTVGEIVGSQRSHDLPWRLQDWQAEHSIFEPFNDPQHGDLMRLSFAAYTQIIPNEHTQVLAEFRDGRPALLERRQGAGRVLWFASSCGRQWSDWPRSRLYLPLVHQMLGYLTGLTEGGPVRNVRIEAAGLDAADAVPGVFRRDGFWEVVNPSARESETDRCPPEEFANRFGLNLGEDDAHTGATVQVAGLSSEELRDDEIWHWAVFGLLGLLLAEGLVANRTAA